MGQYYHPTNLDMKQWIYSHNIKSKFKGYDGKMFEMGQGLKLMEHSYVGNALMNVVERLFMEGGAWFKDRLVWAGDYADNEPEFAGQEDNHNLYSIIGTPENEYKATRAEQKKIPKEYRYIVNYDKMMYIDKTKLEKDSEGFTIHPLSLLTAEGNGRGGGDFRGEDDRIGLWSRDRIGIVTQAPEGMSEVNGIFKESR